MKRAVIVLLLLIANAIVGTELRPRDPSPRRVDYSLGPFGSLDGAAVPSGRQADCPETARLALSVQQATPACRVDGGFEVRLFDDTRL